MTIEDMFGDLKKIDILAEKSETNEVLMVLVRSNSNRPFFMLDFFIIMKSIVFVPLV